MKKIAVILFNLGGPNNPQAVRPFLLNLFGDAAIIRLPQPLRYIIAQIISRRRAPIAQEIYGKMSGGSPILQNTHAQADALQAALNAGEPSLNYQTFIAMRYWHPFAGETAQMVKKFKPDEIIMLPLYPQYSTTTTASSFRDWHRAARKVGLSVPFREICCYPKDKGFIQAVADKTRRAYGQTKSHGTPRILFSAHGLPEKIIKSGDPYAAQCAMTVEAIRAALGIRNLDSVLCFQSRVGPLKWIGPSTDDEVRRAGRDKVPLVVVPIAFVSDHSETLVEIDIEYRHLAEQCGVPHFTFVPAVGAAGLFIDGLADIVRARLNREGACLSATGAQICPEECVGCACRQRRE